MIKNEKGAVLMLMTIIGLMIMSVIILVTTFISSGSRNSEQKIFASDAASYLAAAGKEHAIWQIHQNLMQKRRDESYPVDTKLPLDQAIDFINGSGGYTVKIVNEENVLESGKVKGINYTIESDGFYFSDMNKNQLQVKNIKPSGTKIIFFNYYVPRPIIEVVAPLIKNGGEFKWIIQTLRRNLKPEKIQ